jgi:hypothetical protein
MTIWDSIFIETFVGIAILELLKAFSVLDKLGEKS